MFAFDKYLSCSPSMSTGLEHGGCCSVHAQMLVKERQSGMYRLSAYYLARTASDLPMDCLVPTLFTWVLYFMAGLRLDASGCIFL